MHNSIPTMYTLPTTVYLQCIYTRSTLPTTTVYLQCILCIIACIYYHYAEYTITQHICMAVLCKGTNCMYRKNNKFHTCTVTHITMFRIVIVWACMSISIVLQLMSRKQLKNIISSITIVTQSEVQNVCSQNLW